jgi:hypothetical protein
VYIPKIRIYILQHIPLKKGIGEYPLSRFLDRIWDIYISFDIYPSGVCFMTLPLILLIIHYRMAFKLFFWALIRTGNPQFAGTLNRQKSLFANNGSGKNFGFDYSVCGISSTHGWGSVCKKKFDPRPIEGRNMAISKFWAKIWPKLDFFQIAPVWPKIGLWSTPNIFHTRLVWENTLDTKNWDFVFRKMLICCV